MNLNACLELFDDVVEGYDSPLGTRARNQAATHWRLSLVLNIPQILARPQLKAPASALVLRQAELSRGGGLVRRCAVAFVETATGGLFRTATTRLPADDFMSPDGLACWIDGIRPFARRRDDLAALPDTDGCWRAFAPPGDHPPALDVDLLPLPTHWHDQLASWNAYAGARIARECTAILLQDGGGSEEGAQDLESRLRQRAESWLDRHHGEALDRFAPAALNRLPAWMDFLARPILADLDDGRKSGRSEVGGGNVGGRSPLLSCPSAVLGFGDDRGRTLS